ncbi:MAG: hypothetical protein II875_10020 [Clostridia bacterium]|nr:hypothetical protein [Clostridia bacterium]
MNLQLYYIKNNFDVQKIRRFLKERRLPFAEVDLTRHKIGAREMDLFSRAAGGIRLLVDQSAKGERAEYVKQLSIDEYLKDELLEHPELIRLPILRNGSRILFGYDEKTLLGWLKE